MSERDISGAPGGLVPPERKIGEPSANLGSRRREVAGEPGPSPAGAPAPLYTAHNLHPVHALRYDWTGWPAAGTALPAATADIARDIAPAWEPDGLTLLTAHADAAKVQLLFRAAPRVSPVFCCQRAKGRLQHALRQAGVPATFSRKVAFLSLGENTDADVAGYLRKQVAKEGFADPRFAAIMRQFTVTCPEVALDRPSESVSGRYWYNLHVVLVVASRFRITAPEVLGRLRDAVLAAASGCGARVAAVSVMPDHVHLALRGDAAQSPEAIALAFQNALARAAGCRVWQHGFYVGTFSAYNLEVIRRLAGTAMPAVSRRAQNG